MIQLFVPVVVSFGGGAVDITRVLTDEVYLIKHCVVGTQEVVPLTKQTVVVDLTLVRY